MEKVFTSFASVCDFQGGSQPPKDQWIGHKRDGYIRMLQIRDFTQPDKDKIEYVKESKTLKLCESDDILIGRYGASVGKILTGLSGAYNVAIVKTIPNEALISKSFLYYYLCSPYFQNLILSVGSRAAQAGFNKADLKDAQIPIYPLKQQSIIVKQLGSIDHLISLRQQQLDKLDQLVKSQFIEMFGDPIENPMKWKTARLTDLGACKNGMNFHAGDAGFDLNCLGVGDFKDLAIIDDTSCLPMVSLNEAPPEEYLLQDGDIVFVRSNGNKALVGRCLAVFPRGTKTTFSGFCIRYRLKSKNLLTMYLLHLLKTTSVRQKLVGRGANIQNLNQKILGELMIPVPPIELQDEFTAFIKQADKSKFAIQQSLQKLETLKQSLMQEYFG